MAKKSLYSISTLSVISSWLLHKVMYEPSIAAKN